MGRVSSFDQTDGSVVSYNEVNIPDFPGGIAVGAGKVIVITRGGDNELGSVLESFREQDQDSGPIATVSRGSPDFQRIQVHCLDVEDETSCFVYAAVFTRKDGTDAESTIIRYTMDLGFDITASTSIPTIIADFSIGFNNIITAVTGGGIFYEIDATNLEFRNGGAPFSLPLPENNRALNLILAPQEPNPEDPRPEEPRPNLLLAILGIVILLLIFGLLAFGQLDLRRALTVQEETDNKCFLLTSQKEDQSQVQDDEDGISSTRADQTLEDVVARIETRQAFSADTLRSLYTSLFSGLVDDSASQDGLDVDTMIQDAIALIDTNNDGSIDSWEMEHIQLPAGNSGEFLFDDVVACTGAITTSTEKNEASPDNICVTADNVVNFVNLFFGGTSVVSPELAQHIREESGPDTCLTRTEFEALFQSPATNNNHASLLSAASDVTLSMNRFSLVFGMGMAMMALFGLS